MQTTIQTTVNLKSTAYVHNGQLKTHPCDLGDWYGSEICDDFSIDRELSKIKLPEGEYEVEIIVKKVQD